MGTIFPLTRSDRLAREPGAPGYWSDLAAPRRTFPGDAGDVADRVGRSPAAVRENGAAWAVGPSGGMLVCTGGGATFRHRVTGPPLTLWARTRLDAAGSYRGLLICRDDGLVGIDLSAAAGNPLTANWNNSAGEYGAPTGLVLDPGRWYTVAAVFTPTAITIHRADHDAGTIATHAIAAANPLRTLTNWTLGRDPDASPWAGAVDDARIYARALDPAEFARLAFGPAAKQELRSGPSLRAALRSAAPPPAIGSRVPTPLIHRRAI